MTTLTPESRLLWALRFHARALGLLALLTLALTALAVALLVLSPPSYEARAAVIATDLEFSAERVPRLAEAIVQQDAVLEDALARGRLPWDVDELRDEHVEVVPLEDNVLVNVDGTARDPELAMDTANAVADALAAALRRSGTEATFSVQSRATRAVPEDRLVPVAVTVVAGLVATATAVVGLAALLLALRRPLVAPRELAAVTSAPVLAVLDPPRRHGGGLPLPGTARLQRAVDQRGARTVVVAGPPGATRKVSAVAMSLAQRLGLDRDTTLVVADASPQAAADVPDDTHVLLHRRDEPLPTDAGTVVVDGLGENRPAWQEWLPADGLGVVVLPEGVRRDEAAEAVDAFSPGDVGVVFVSRRRRQRAAERASAAGPVRGTGPVEPAADRRPHPTSALGWPDA
jgi:capsular polysaccharide biosynthesis protein